MQADHKAGIACTDNTTPALGPCTQVLEPGTLHLDPLERPHDAHDEPHAAHCRAVCHMCVQLRRMRHIYDPVAAPS